MICMCSHFIIIIIITFQVDDALLQSFHRVEFEDVSLLGAPLFPGVALDTA